MATFLDESILPVEKHVHFLEQFYYKLYRMYSELKSPNRNR